MQTIDIAETQDLYKLIKQNRLTMYSQPKRYYNREGQTGSAFKFLFLLQTIIFILMMIATKSAVAQQKESNPLLAENVTTATANISNYTTVYNSGKVFLNWTAKNEPADCIYIVERSGDGKDFMSVGIKEGVGTNVELFYSWMDETPPAGYAFYRVKKITKEGTQFYSAVNSVINQGSSFDPKSNYASGAKGLDTKKH